MLPLLVALWKDESGQDTTEYILLVALIALAVTAAMIAFAEDVNGAYESTSTGLDNQMQGLGGS